jgi:hypothetical protein
MQVAEAIDELQRQTGATRDGQSRRC